MLEDVAILTGGQAIFEALGVKLENLTLNDLGRAKKVIIDKDNTTVIEGAGKSDDIKGRIAQLRREIEASTSDYDREKLEERLAQRSRGAGKGNNGFNALTNEYEDLVKAGVIDPTKVTRTALANAASVATLLLTSDALIAEKPKDDKHGSKKSGHGGDYDMY